MAQRNLLLLSNSTLHPTGYLEYAKETIIKFLKEKKVEKVNSKSQPSLVQVITQRLYGRRFLLFWFSNFTLIQVLFIPFALTDQDEYARIARAPFEQWGFQLVSIHEAMQSEDPVMTVNKAQAIFIGGGNTFRLLKKLYDNNLVEPIRKRVLGR